LARYVSVSAARRSAAASYPALAALAMPRLPPARTSTSAPGRPDQAGRPGRAGRRPGRCHSRGRQLISQPIHLLGERLHLRVAAGVNDRVGHGYGASTTTVALWNPVEPVIRRARDQLTSASGRR